MNARAFALVALVAVVALSTACQAPSAPSEQPSEADDGDGFLDERGPGGAPAPEIESILIEPDGRIFAVTELGRFQLDPVSFLDPVELAASDDADSEGEWARVLPASARPSRVLLDAFQTPIRDQGARGTCVAFAVVAALEARYLREGLTLDLSEQFVNHIGMMRWLKSRFRIDEIDDQHETRLGTEGGYLRHLALRNLIDYRVPLETVMPYIPSLNYENTNQEGDVPRIDVQDANVTQRVYSDFNLNSVVTDYFIPDPISLAPLPRAALTDGVHGITGFVTANSEQVRDVAWYESRLADGHEIIISVMLCGDPIPDNGIWDPGTSMNCGGHAMLMVGYDRARRPPFFFVKNSWGESNYVRLSYEYVTSDSHGHVVHAHVITGVVDPATGVVPKSAALGRRNVVLSGAAIGGSAEVTGVLDVYRLPGLYGLEDRRIGTLHAEDGASFRVNAVPSFTPEQGLFGYHEGGLADFELDVNNPAMSYTDRGNVVLLRFVDNMPEATWASPDGYMTEGDHFRGPASLTRGSDTFFAGNWTLHGHPSLREVDVSPHTSVVELTRADGTVTEGQYENAGGTITLLDCSATCVPTARFILSASDPGVGFGGEVEPGRPTGLIAVHTGISVSSFGVHPRPAIVGEDVVFSWTTSHLDGVPMRCTVDVQGEGFSPVATVIPSCHGPQMVWGSFERAGRYTATLTVEAATGVATTRSMPVEAISNVIVEVVPEAVAIYPRSSHEFTATVTGTSDTRVDWSASCGSISGSGATVTYTAFPIAGECFVRATSVADPDVSAAARVTVTPVDAATLSGEIASLPNGTWRATLLYPSLLTTSSTFEQVGASVPIASSGSFSLDLTPIMPPPVHLVIPTMPPGVTLDPANTAGAMFSLLAFDDTNGNQLLDPGEFFYEINDPANTFGIAFILEYATNPHTITGSSQTTAGSPVTWNVVSAGGWERKVYRFIAGGSAVEVAADGQLTGLPLTLGRSGTIAAAGITTLSSPIQEPPPGLFVPWE